MKAQLAALALPFALASTPTEAQTTGTISRIKHLTTGIVETATVLDMQEVSLPPLTPAPVHAHPCKVIGYLLSGTILFQIGDEKPVVLKSGDPFIEPANTRITHFDNISDTDPARFLAIYLKDIPEQREVEVLYQ